MVDVVGQLRGQRAERVVRQGGEVDHRVEAREVLGLDVAQVDPMALGVVRRRAEHAVGEQPVIQADHLVTRVDEHGGHHGAQITLVPGQQHAHPVHPPAKSRVSL